MADYDKKTNRERVRDDKADRLAEALRENLRKRKQLQRNRGSDAPDAIKNKNRLTD